MRDQVDDGPTFALVIARGGCPVNAVPALQVYMMAERFDRALKLIRGALAEMDLDVAGES